MACRTIGHRREILLQSQTRQRLFIAALGLARRRLGEPEADGIGEVRLVA